MGTQATMVASPKGGSMGRKRTRPTFKRPDLRQKFCLRLHDYIDKSDVTYDRIADACGVTKAAVVRWFNATATPGVEHLPAIAALFGVKDYRDLLPPS